MWWLKHGLVGWVVLSAIWGFVSIAYDIVIECVFGSRDTISWQTQQAAINNPIIPAAVGLVIGGLTIHFFKVRDWDLFNNQQPWLYWFAGFVAGAILVFLTWTQRG